MAERKPRRPTAARKRRARAAGPARPRRPQTTGRRKTGARLGAAVRKQAAAAPAERRRQGEPQTLRLRSIMPSLTVDDIERSLRFYTDVLGFFVGERWEQGGKLQGAMLKAGACELGLSQDDWAKGRDRKKGVGMSLWCLTVQDIDALASRIKAAGARLADGPKDQPEGGRSLSVDDPDGFRIRIYRESEGKG